MSRDTARLTSWLKGLGIKVVFKPETKQTQGDAGYFLWDESTIEVLTSPKQSSTDRLLTLLHEAGHALDWIELGRPKIEQVELSFDDDVLDRSAHERTRLLAFEERAIRNMLKICRLLKLSIQEWRVKAEMETDRWVYRIYRAIGVFPSIQQIKAKGKAVRKKWQKRYKAAKLKEESSSSK